MFSLALAGDIEIAKRNLQRSGLAAAEVTPMQIPFYSTRRTISAYLIKVTRDEGASFGTGQNTAGDRNAELSAGPYRANIFAAQEPSVMKAGATQVLHLKVRNVGNDVWKARAPQGWMNIVTVGDRWLTADARSVVNEMDSRCVLPHDLKPGEETELVLTVTAPQAPGEYVLELDMVHEGVTWFYQQGSPTLRWHVKVKN
jgi:hypothetical protein